MSRLLHRDMLLALLLALSTLGSIGWATHVAWKHPYDGLDWITTGHITSIDPAGPTAQSRLRIGDRVFAIDGQPWQIHTAPYLGKVEGDRVDLTVIRADESLSIVFRLTTPPHRVRLLLLEPLLISLVFWGVGLITWILHPWQRVTQLFLFMSQIMAVLLAMGLLSVLNVPAGTMAFTILLPLSAAVMLHFYTLFPRPLTQRLQRRLVRATYGVSAGLIGVTLLTFTLMHTIPPVVRTGQRGLVALMLLGALGVLYLEDGTTEELLRVDPGENVSLGVWSADSRSLLYVRTGNGRKLYRLNVADATSQLIISGSSSYDFARVLVVPPQPGQEP